ncbi:MAG: hypothetical protein QOH72_3440 [Solirubrobacteraceae bacterium]|nr:hypothetical protein [Solirubrobacteraceae bacterium]
MPLASRRSLVALVLGLLVAAAAVAGCAASSSGGGGSDPAALVPAGAPLYAEAVFGGDAQEQADAQAALAKILRTADPRGELVKAFDRGNVDFARDVEPWLGDRVGAAALSLGARGDKVVVAASRDDAAARAALARLAPKGSPRTYRGVAYRVDQARGTAAAVVGGFVVLGSENGLKAAIDASKGSSLAESDSLKQARANVRRQRSAFLYVDVAGFLREALGATGGGASQLAPFAQPVALALPKTIAAALDAEPGMLRLDSAAFGNGGGFASGASGADALAALPADAWLGAGVGELGPTVNGLLDRVSAQGGIAGVGLQALLGQAQQRLGLDIRRDLLAWMGDAGIYVAGTTAADRRAALVIASKDPAASQRAVRALEPLARRSGTVTPLTVAGVDAGFALRRGRSDDEILVASGGNRFVVAVGRRALTEAVAPGGARLGDAAAFRAAAGKLGSGVRPSFFLDVQRLSGMAPGKGAGHGGQLREYLGAFGAVIGGARRDGDVTRGEAVATLR